jgi:hypothetical protein
MESSDDSKKNFVKYVFNFNDNTKAELLNVVQYSILAVVPLVCLNKLISTYIPDIDESKGTVEMIAEIIIQILVMFIGFFYINRIICYVPTYSGEEYPQNNVIYIILAVLMIILSINSRLGEKVNILLDRIMELWDGKSSKNKNKKAKVKVSQPIAGRLPPTLPPSNTSNVALSNSFSDGTAINSLPTSDMSQNNNQNMLSPQQLPDYNQFFQKDPTPLVNAAQPGSESFTNDTGPLAANSVLGGSFGSSW